MEQCAHCGRSEKDVGGCPYCEGRGEYYYKEQDKEQDKEQKEQDKEQPTSWLIGIGENDGKHWPAVPTYVFVDHKGDFGFTTDGHGGMRFARRIDAERLIMLLLGMEFPSAGRYVAVGWVT